MGNNNSAVCFGATLLNSKTDCLCTSIAEQQHILSDFFELGQLAFEL